MRTATVRDYVDADILGLAHILAPLRVDLTFRENPAERQAVRDSGARMVTLADADADATTKWIQLELLVRRWRQIEALLDEPDPFIYLDTFAHGMVKLDLDK